MDQQSHQNQQQNDTDLQNEDLNYDPSTQSIKQKIWDTCKPFLYFTILLSIIIFAVIVSGIYKNPEIKMFEGKAVIGDDTIMNNKINGSCINQVQQELLYNTQQKTANSICCHNRKYTQSSKQWEKSPLKTKIIELSEKQHEFIQENKLSQWNNQSCPIKQDGENYSVIQNKYLQFCDKQKDFLNQEQFNILFLEFYDVVTGKSLFQIPVSRYIQEFVEDSIKFGWLSFRDSEVNWDNVRVLENGETVSIDGTHLGKNVPDIHGNNFLINLACISGQQNL